jgi:hypothetical protein
VGAIGETVEQEDDDGEHATQANPRRVLETYLRL